VPRRSKHEAFYNEVATQLWRQRQRPYRLTLPAAHVVRPEAFGAAMRVRGLAIHARWIPDQDPPALLIFDQGPFEPGRRRRRRRYHNLATRPAPAC
jgi:hypothetical protein